MTKTRKSTPTTGKVYRRQRARYIELVSLFPLRPIRTEGELDVALRVIDMLVDLEHRTRTEDDYLDVISDLVIAYEAVHYPDDPVSDAEMLQSFLDDWRLTQAEVAKGAGIAESTISEVLSGKRKLNRKQIGKLARYFRVDPGVFAFPG